MASNSRIFSCSVSFCSSDDSGVGAAQTTGLLTSHKHDRRIMTREGLLIFIEYKYLILQGALSQCFLLGRISLFGTSQKLSSSR